MSGTYRIQNRTREAKPFRGDGGFWLADSLQIFGRCLGHWLKKRKLSGAELGRQLGVGRSAVSHWLNGHSGPDLRTVGQIAEILDIPVRDLFYDEDDLATHSTSRPKQDPRERAIMDLAKAIGIDVRIRRAPKFKAAD